MLQSVLTLVKFMYNVFATLFWNLSRMTFMTFLAGCMEILPDKYE